MHFNLTCCNFIISLLSGSNLTCHFDHILATKALGRCHDFRTDRLWIDDQLHNPFTISQINKDQATQITASTHPSFEG